MFFQDNYISVKGLRIPCPALGAKIKFFSLRCQPAAFDKVIELPAELPERPAAVNNGKPETISVFTHFFGEAVTQVIAKENNNFRVPGNGFSQVSGFSAGPVSTLLCAASTL